MPVTKPKLIYLDSASNQLDTLERIQTWLKNNGNNYDWDNSNNSFYHSVIFSKTGYLITHGKVFNGGLSINGIGTGSFYALESVGSNGQIVQSNGTKLNFVDLDSTISQDSTSTGVPSSSAVYNYVSTALSANDAMVFKGTYSPTSSASGGAVDITRFSTQPGNDSKGWTWVVSNNGQGGYFANEFCPDGTMIISNVDAPSTTKSNYTIVKTNLSGAMLASNYPDLCAIEPLTGTGFLKRTGNETWALENVIIGLSTNTTSNTVTNTSGLQIGTTVDGSPGTSASTSAYLRLALKSYSKNDTNTTGVAVQSKQAVEDANKYYPVELDKNGILAVYVPWTDSLTTDTWRPVYAYTASTSSTLAQQLPSSTGTAALQFGQEFIYTDLDNNGVSGASEIHLAWADVSANGTTITYTA